MLNIENDLNLMQNKLLCIYVYISLIQFIGFRWENTDPETDILEFVGQHVDLEGYVGHNMGNNI